MKAISQAKTRILSRFRSLNPITVALAGLIDGVNPCAFTTLIFFISYLFYVGKKGRTVLLVGASFAAGVFITYFLMGLGVMGLVKYLTKLHWLARAVNLLVAAAVIILGIVSFVDFLKARSGRLNEITLQLPDAVKTRIHGRLKKSAGSASYVSASFIAGAAVSLLELACTGQVYLPTIVFVASQNNMRQAAVAYLILYNIMFILPLIAIFLVAYKGTTSQKLTSLAGRHVAPVKLALAILFICMGALLIVS